MCRFTAEYYDLLYGSLDDDESMWQTLTEEVDGPILEVGCGTGRLLLPLAQAGHTLTGLDLSKMALDAAQAKIRAAGLTKRVSVRLADMRNFELPQRNFALALIPLNTFMHAIPSTTNWLPSNDLPPPATRRPTHIDLFYPDPTMPPKPMGVSILRQTRGRFNRAHRAVVLAARY
jgi:SAM-dependent methyltransferase